MRSSFGCALVVVAGVAAGCGGGTSTHPSAAAPAHRPARSRRTVARLRVVAARQLPQPVQLPALAVAHGALLAAGGLDASDVSVSSVTRAAPGRPRLAGALPQAV